MSASTPSFARLQQLLRELFQFDRADLDFGIYRIMNQRREEVDRFLEEDLLPQVRDALGQFSDQQQASKQAELDDLGRQLRDAGVEPEASPKYLALKQEIESAGQLEAVEAEVYSDLYTFFSRFYDEGDFISQRRYKAGVYAIPYEGEEVKLHWANADQYYVKTTEDFQDYRFKLSDDRFVHFKIVAADTERDNNKAANGKDRRFLLRAESPAAEVDEDLELYFEYVPHPDTQSSLNERTVETVLSDDTVKPWRDVLCQSVGNKTILEKHLATYTTKNSLDYFIHKDLGGFLRRELDFFLKNEIAHLDDLENADAQRADQYLARLRAIRRIGHKIIQFLAQLEDFQKQLYLKKKLVLETNYLVTLDRVPEALHDQIVANDVQWAEWNHLFALEVPSDESARRTLLSEESYLVVDTSLYETDFRHNLLNNIDLLDVELGGLLVKGDNFQAVNLLSNRFAGKVDTIYIDPPYNTEYDREVGNFIYKDSYDQSCWTSMMADRLVASKGLLAGSGSFICSIDDNQVAVLRLLSDEVFGRNNFVSNIAWKSRDSVSSDHIVSKNHNYHLVYAKNVDDSMFGGFPIDADDYSNPDNDPRGPWKPVPLDANKPGGDTNYPIRNPNTGKDYYPPNGRSWAINRDDYKKLFDDNRIAFGKKGTSAPKRKLFYRERMDKDDFNTPISIWADAETTKDGTTQLVSLFGRKVFSYPKPVGVIRDLLRIANRNPGSVVMDFFAGSGTTGHAVISLNREENQHRQFVLAEMGEYFESVLKPRICKTIYSSGWADGRPMSRNGVSQIVKYSVLESYEDTLSNLDLAKPDGPQQALLDTSGSLREDYILNYMLAAESAGGAARLNLEQFTNPFEYQIKTVQGGETQLSPVDLPETFNWLLGLTVEKIRFIDGYQTVEGIDPDGQRVLIIWRNLTEEDHTNEKLEEFFKSEGYLGREPDNRLDHVYVNGDCTLSSLKSEGDTWHLHLTEEAFQRLMFDTHEGGR